MGEDVLGIIWGMKNLNGPAEVDDVAKWGAWRRCSFEVLTPVGHIKILIGNQATHLAGCFLFTHFLKICHF